MELQEELRLVHEVARQFRTEEREFLETELLGKLLRLKSQPKHHVRHWKNFLWISLRNHAINFLRDRPPIDATPIDPVESIVDDAEHGNKTGVVISSLEPSLDRQASVAGLWELLDPKLQRLCNAIIEKGWNKAAIARRLRKHPNTIRHWMSQLRDVMQRQGYEIGDRR